MFGLGARDAVRSGVVALALSCGALLAVGCTSASKSAEVTSPSDVAVSATVLHGAGPGQACHPASPPSVQGEPTVVMPKVAPDHLVVHDIRLGKGAVAEVGRDITVQYVGVACSTGTQFDATWDRGTPYGVTLKPPVMEGWLQGVAGMRVGGLRQLVIPPALGYGEEGFKKAVRPGETLVYVIELQAVR